MAKLVILKDHLEKKGIDVAGFIEYLDDLGISTTPESEIDPGEIQDQLEDYKDRCGEVTNVLAAEEKEY